MQDENPDADYPYNDVLDPEWFEEEEFNDDLLAIVTGSRPQGRFSGQPS